VAQKIQTLFIDDLDGSEAEGTVRFGLDGTEYEIDLNAEHAQALRDALARYVRAARRAGGAARRPARGGRMARADGVDSTEVREWAKAQGIEVHNRSVGAVLGRLRAQRRLRRLADESGGTASEFDRGAFLLGKQLMYFERYGKLFLADVPLLADREFFEALLASAPSLDANP